MKKYHLSEGLSVPVLAVGCMRMSEKTPEEVCALVRAAMDEGIFFFDHADIYGGGQSEKIFAEAVRELGIARDEMLLQTKCGIRPGLYDFSAGHIVESVEGSLKRLGTDYMDVLLLHRPDTLMEPEEVSEAFDSLRRAGKVRHFGVSNFNPMQIELLKQAVGDALIIDQMQFGVAHTLMIDEGFNVNIANGQAASRTEGILEYCRLKKMLIQAWSPFQYGMFEGVFWSNPKYAGVVAELNALAEKYDVTREAMAVAWILRHPAHIQVICGTTNSARLRQLARAAEITMSREEWYRIYLAAGNSLP